MTGTNGVVFPDDFKLKLGTGSDFQIYHDLNDNNSYIKELGSGSLQIWAKDFEVYNAGGTETLINADVNAGVQLYFNNSTKIATTNTGVTVTGQITTTGTSPSIIFNETDVTANWRNRVSSGSYRVQYASDGSTFSDYFVLGASANTVAKDTTFAGNVTIDRSTDGSLIFESSGAAKFLVGYDSSPTGFRIYNYVASETSLFIDVTNSNTTFAGKILAGTGATASATINAYTTTVSTNLFSALRVIENSTASSYWDIGATGGSSTLLNFYHNGTTSPKISFTHTGGATFTGSVGIGLTNPLAKLDVDGVIRSTDNNSGDYLDIYCDGSVSGNSIIESSANNIEIIPQTGILELKGDDYGSGQNAELQIFNSSDVVKVKLDTSGDSYLNGGNLGIGITNPQAPLSFANVVGSKIDFYHNTTSSDRYGIEVQSSELRIHSGAQGNSTGGITFGKKTTSTFTEAMRITNAGSVGIGTTLPKTSLDIVKNSDIWHLMVGGLTKKLLVGGQAVSGDVVLQAGAASTANNAAVTTAYNLCLQRDGGNVGVGNANPQSKLHVAGGIQMANDTDTASASKVGTLKYYTSGNNSYVDMCMQTGATTYEWINIVQNNW
jgi:hypothetical protein